MKTVDMHFEISTPDAPERANTFEMLYHLFESMRLFPGVVNNGYVVDKKEVSPACWNSSLAQEQHQVHSQIANQREIIAEGLKVKGD